MSTGGELGVVAAVRVVEGVDAAQKAADWLETTEVRQFAIGGAHVVDVNSNAVLGEQCRCWAGVDMP